MINLVKLSLNLESNKITQKGIIHFINRFDKVKKIEKVEVNLSSNDFGDNKFEELLDYFGELEKVKFIIILSNQKMIYK